MRSAIIAGACLSLSFACSGKTLPYPGGLMVAVQTNLAAPKDVAAVGLFISSDGRPIFSDTRDVAPNGEVKFPATIAVVADEGRPNAVVKVRAVAFKRDGSVRVLRDIITTIPKGRTGLLRAPLLWINEGSGTGNRSELLAPTALRPLDDTSNGFGAIKSACPDGQTFIAGECADAKVDGNALPEYSESAVYGGGKANGEGGKCFDVLGCFASRTDVALDPETCTAVLPNGNVNDGKLSFAVSLPASSDTGECTGSECLVPLDRGVEWSVEGTSVRFVKGLCQRLKDGRAAGIVATVACEAKDETMPSCGPASSVGSGPAGSADASTPPTPPSGGTSDFETPSAFGGEPFLSAVATTPTEIFVARTTMSPPPAGIVQFHRKELLEGGDAPARQILVGYGSDAGADPNNYPASIVVDPGLMVARNGQGQIDACALPSGPCRTVATLVGPRGALALTVDAIYAFGTDIELSKTGLWKFPRETAGGDGQLVVDQVSYDATSLAIDTQGVYIPRSDGGIDLCAFPCDVGATPTVLRQPSDEAVVGLVPRPDGTSVFFALVSPSPDKAGIYELTIASKTERRVIPQSIFPYSDESGPARAALAVDTRYLYWGGTFVKPGDTSPKSGVLRMAYASAEPSVEIFAEAEAAMDPVSSIAVDPTHVFWTYARQNSALNVVRKGASF